MDLSSLAETQQQQQQQPQEQQQHYHPAQAYAYEAYYGYHQQHYDPSASHRYHHYHLYDYATTYQQPPHPAAPPQDPSSTPAVAAQHQAAGASWVPAYWQGSQGSYSAPPGLNPAAAAAVAALSPLSQIAGTMDAAERAMARMQGRQWRGERPPETLGQMAPSPLHPLQYPAQHRGVHPGVGYAILYQWRANMRVGNTKKEAFNCVHKCFDRHFALLDVDLRVNIPFHFSEYAILYQWRANMRVGNTKKEAFNCVHKCFDRHFAFHDVVGVRTPSEVGSRRGSWPFRGGRNGGRGNLGHYSHGPGGGASLFRGRGQGAHMGRGGGRRFRQSAKTSSTEPESAEARVSGLAPAPTPCPRLPIAWCDICRVDCNSLEILEQHKNGKRHKRTVQRFEEIQAQQKLLAEAEAQTTIQGLDGTVIQPQVMAESQGVIRHPETVVQAAEENRIVQMDEEIKTSTVSEELQEHSACENTIKSELHDQVADEQKVREGTEEIIYLPPVEGPTRGHPPKRRMMRFSRDAKRFRYFRPNESRPKERPKEQPRICTLCNVMCETQVFFDSHIAGKKHISRIKRFQGNAVYGPLALDVYIPPNQPSMHNAPGPQPLFFGLKTQEMVNLVAQDPCTLMETYGPHEPDQGEPAVSVLQMDQVGGTQSSGSLASTDQAVVTIEVKGQSAVTVFEAEDALSTQSAQPGSTVKEAESVFTSGKEAVVSETSTVVDVGPTSMAPDPSVTTTEYVTAEADVAVTTTGNVVSEVGAACRLIEHVAAEAEMACEIEDAVEAKDFF